MFSIQHKTTEQFWFGFYSLALSLRLPHSLSFSLCRSSSFIPYASISNRSALIINKISRVNCWQTKLFALFAGPIWTAIHISAYININRKFILSHIHECIIKLVFSMFSVAVHVSFLLLWERSRHMMNSSAGPEHSMKTSNNQIYTAERWLNCI